MVSTLRIFETESPAALNAVTRYRYVPRPAPRVRKIRGIRERIAYTAERPVAARSFDPETDLIRRITQRGDRRLGPRGHGVPSIHVRFTAVNPARQSRPGLWRSSRPTLNLIGRIMSISSWLRMWQCHTYSQPKLNSCVGDPRTVGAVRVDVRELPGGTERHRRVQRTNAVGHTERSFRRPAAGPRCSPPTGSCERSLSSQLVRLGRLHHAGPVDPVDQLHVEQVEVNRVGVHAVVGDLPDLSAISGSPICVAEVESLRISVAGSMKP